MTVRQVTATMNLHPELRAQYDLVAADAGDANVHPDWRQMLLFPCSAYPSDTDEWSVDVCTSCKTSLDGRSEHPPKNSIANGNYRGFASKTPGLADVPEQVGVRRIRATLPLPTTGVLSRVLTLLRIAFNKPTRCGLFFGTAFQGNWSACACLLMKVQHPPRFVSRCRAPRACES